MVKRCVPSLGAVTPLGRALSSINVSSSTPRCAARPRFSGPPGPGCWCVRLVRRSGSVSGLKVEIGIE